MSELSKPIVAHKCFEKSIRVEFYRKCSAKRCPEPGHECRYNEDVYLPDETIDAINLEIFNRLQFEFEIENDVKSFFYPNKITQIIDRGVNKPYKTSWKPKGW